MRRHTTFALLALVGAVAGFAVYWKFQTPNDVVTMGETTSADAMISTLGAVGGFASGVYAIFTLGKDVWLLIASRKQR